MLITSNPRCESMNVVCMLAFIKSYLWQMCFLYHSKMYFLVKLNYNMKRNGMEETGNELFVSRPSVYE